MRRLALLLLLISFLAHAEEPSLPRHLSTCEGLPQTLVGGCVNVITGHFVETEADLQTTGPRPFVLGRYFCNNTPDQGSLCHGWNFLHHHQGNVTALGTYQRLANCSTSWGTVAEYWGGGKNPWALTLSPWSSKGATNWTQELPNGRRNLTSTTVDMTESDWDFRLNEGSGTKRFFVRRSFGRFDPHAKFFQIRLKRQENPDGSQFLFNVDKKDHLTDVTVHGPNPGEPWAALTFQYNQDSSLPEGLVNEVVNEAGDWVRYGYVREIKKSDNWKGLLIERVDRWDGTYTSYEYSSKKTYPLVTKKTWGFNRFLKVDYYKQGHNLVMGQDIHLRDAENPRVGRVLEIQAPLGKEETPITAYRFTYDWKKKREKKETILEEGYTTVQDALDNRIVYVYGRVDELTGVTKYKRDQGVYKAWRSDRFFYRFPEKSGGRWIRNHTVYQEGQALHSRTFDYDASGNVTKESLYGVLTGPRSVTPAVTYCGAIEGNGCESYYISRAFSNCGRNLLLQQSEPNGKNTLFTYLPNTDLLVSRIEMDRKNLVSRLFLEYDNDRLPVAKIQDYGDGTPQNIERVQYAQGEIKGLVEIETQSYSHQGQDILLRRVERSFNHRGQVLKERYFDANEVEVYGIEFTYDDRGLPLTKADSRGLEDHYDYDQNHNLMCSYKAHSGLCTRNSYDWMDRQIWSTVEGPHGLLLEERVDYDLMGNPITKWDYHNNATYQAFDESGNVIQERLPAINLPTGEVIEPTRRMAYDVEGNCVKEVDPLGATTRKTYNARGQCLSIVHPDGTMEQFRYAHSGAPITHYHVDGSITQYVYDTYMRKRQETQRDAAGSVLQEKTFEYQGPLLVQENVTGGPTTYYEYDGAGRKTGIRLVNGETERRSQLEYDALGRLAVVREWHDGHRYRATHYTYDLFDHVVDETIRDEQGTILRRSGAAFDLDGNQTALISYDADGTPQIHRKEYDAIGRLTEEIDPQGHKTLYFYDDHAINSLGQNVLVLTKVDALGIRYVSEHDAHGRIHCEKVFDALGVLLQSQTTYYDAKGQKIQLDHERLYGGSEELPYMVHWTYDACGRLVAETEGATSHAPRTTFHVYDPQHHTEVIIKPDTVHLTKISDHLERILELTASDGTFQYRYTYDLAGNLTQVVDEIAQTATLRSYDPLGNMVSETLSNGLNSTFSYDELGRCIGLTLPDGSGASYEYGAAYLHRATRFDAVGTKLYTYTADQHDLSGRLVQATLPGQAGCLIHTFDENGKTTLKKTVHWTQEIPKGGWNPVGRLMETQISDLAGEHAFSYEYDGLGQIQRETGPVSHTYGFDSLYNMRAEDGIDHTIDNLNQLRSTPNNTFQYTENGELKEQNGARYIHDALGRLLIVEMGDVRLVFAYDAFHRRTEQSTYEKSSSDEWSLKDKALFLYQGDYETGLMDETGTLVQVRLLVPSQNGDIGAAVAIEFNSQTFVPIHDLRGNVCALLDSETGHIAESCLYGAFGERLVTGGQPLANPWRFSSKRYNENAQLYYFGRRYYSPELRRWTTPDPMGFVDGPNLYAYVKNCPTNAIDLFGFSTARPQEDCLVRKCWGFCCTTVDRVVTNLNPFQVRSCVFDLSDNPEFKELPNGRLFYVNGICTSIEQARAHAENLGRLAGGYNVTVVYNATHGIFFDILESALNLFFGWKTPPAKLLREELDKYYDEAGQEARAFITAHSQGGIHTRNVIHEGRDRERGNRTDVLAVASAAYINNELCGSVLGLRAPFHRDPVPYFDFIGNLRYSANTVTLPCHPEATGFDHYLGSPTYRAYIRMNLEDFADRSINP